MLQRLPAIRLIAVLLLVLGVQGCATTSVFNPYPNQAAAYKAAITNGTIDSVTAKLVRQQQGKDGLLYAQESGRLHQLNKQYDASKADFAEVYRRYREQDEAARLSAGGAASGTASLLTNDNAIPYTGYGFERIFALHFQALNYLALGDAEAAAVELRRAAVEQRTLELANEKAIAKAEQQANSDNIDTGSWQNAPELAGMSRMAGKVKSSFQNAYTFYTSALIWEAMGDLNAALVDYKKALEINPDNTVMLQDVQRLDKGQRLAQDKGHLVVLFEDGFVVERNSFDLALPYFASGGSYVTYFTVSFPYYPAAKVPQPLQVFSGNHSLGTSRVIADIDAMAAKSLIENIPLMIVRMVLRARAKHELHKQSADQGGILGSLAATIYNVVSEQADRRNWLTLPANVQLLRAEITPGTQQLELNLQGVSRSITVNTQAGRVTLLRVVNANNRMITEQFQL